MIAEPECNRIGIRSVPAVYGVTYTAGDVFFTVPCRLHEDAIALGIVYLTRWERYGDVAVNHVGTIVGPGLGVEAQMRRGTVCCDMHDYFEDPRVLVLIRRPFGLTPHTGQVLSAIARGRVGRPYDKALIAAHGIAGTILGRALDRLFGGRVREALAKRLQRDDADICSEGVAIILREWRRRIGMALSGCLGESPETITPQRLFEDRTVFEEWKKGDGAPDVKLATVERIMNGVLV